MSSPLTYLTLRKLKNTFLQILKKPVYIVYLVLLIGVVFITIRGGEAGFDASKLRDPNELIAIANVLFVFILLTSVLSGFSQGGSFFSLQDVHLIFTAPIRPTRILFYGLLSQAKNSILIGIFLLFQYTILHTTWGLSYWHLILLLLAYSANFFFGQVLGMTIYCATVNDENRRKVLKGIVYFLLILYVGLIGYVMLTNASEGYLKAAVLAFSKVGPWFPFSGWLCLAFRGVLMASSLDGFLGLGLCAAGLTVMVFALEKIQPDYYEDVLQTAETTYTAALASKSGKVADAAPKKVKLGKTGIGKGWGASAFYYKHLLENRRAAVALFSPMELMFLAMTVLFAFFMGRGDSETGIVAVLAFSAYMQVLSVSMGRMVRELSRPWVYLVPEKSLSKLIWCMAESLRSSVADALVFAVAVGLVLGQPPLMILVLFAYRYCFTVLFLSANVLMQRLFGSLQSKALTLVFFIVLVLLMAAPGIALGILVQMLHASVWSFLLAMCVGNVLTSLLVLFFSRNLLSVIEFNL